MTPDDLAAQRTERMTPLSIPWHGCELVAHPPNSQAALALMVLGALAGDRDASDLDWTHLSIEALKDAFEIRCAHDGACHPSIRAARSQSSPSTAKAARCRSSRASTWVSVPASSPVELVSCFIMAARILASKTGIQTFSPGANVRSISSRPGRSCAAENPNSSTARWAATASRKRTFNSCTRFTNARCRCKLRSTRRVSATAARMKASSTILFGWKRVSIRRSSRAYAPRSHRRCRRALRRRDGARDTFAGGADPRADSLALGY